VFALYCNVATDENYRRCRVGGRAVGFSRRLRLLQDTTAVFLARLDDETRATFLHKDEREAQIDADDEAHAEHAPLASDDRLRLGAARKEMALDHAQLGRLDAHTAQCGD